MVHEHHNINTNRSQSGLKLDASFQDHCTRGVPGRLSATINARTARTSRDNHDIRDMSSDCRDPSATHGRSALYPSVPLRALSTGPASSKAPDFPRDSAAFGEEENTLPRDNAIFHQIGPRGCAQSLRYPDPSPAHPLEPPSGSSL